LILFVEILTK